MAYRLKETDIIFTGYELFKFDGVEGELKRRKLMSFYRKMLDILYKYGEENRLLKGMRYLHEQINVPLKAKKKKQISLKAVFTNIHKLIKMGLLGTKKVASNGKNEYSFFRNGNTKDNINGNSKNDLLDIDNTTFEEEEFRPSSSGIDLYNIYIDAKEALDLTLEVLEEQKVKDPVTRNVFLTRVMQVKGKIRKSSAKNYISVMLINQLAFIKELGRKACQNARIAFTKKDKVASGRVIPGTNLNVCNRSTKRFKERVYTEEEREQLYWDPSIPIF